MVAVEVEHVIISTCVLLGKFLDDLVQSVVHYSHLSEVYLPVEDVVCTLGLHLKNSRVLRVCRTYTVTVF